MTDTPLRKPQEGLTALINAAEVGSEETVAYLMEKGADVDEMSTSG